MTPAGLIAFRDELLVRKESFVAQVNGFDPAPEDAESIDYRADAYSEALFLRSFTAYEGSLEALFLHYVTGGASLSGRVANRYLSITDEALARKLTRAGYKFLSWGKPQDIKATAENYMERGWPISDMMNAKSQDLTDCEKVRNRIAHSSIEALINFNAVQRNLLTTERLFPISPGQFLRIRNRRLRKLHIRHYLDVMHDTLTAILDPPM